MHTRAHLGIGQWESHSHGLSSHHWQALGSMQLKEHLVANELTGLKLFTVNKQSKVQLLSSLLFTLEI